MCTSVSLAHLQCEHAGEVVHSHLEKIVLLGYVPATFWTIRLLFEGSLLSL